LRSDLITAYLRWAFMRAVLARGWWLCTGLYLVVVADLPPSQLVLIGVCQHVTVLVAEVPAGVLADAVSRRLALVVAHLVLGVGMAITGVVTGFGWLVVSQCLWGLGWAISSGADVAWITDELDGHDVIDEVLVAQGRRELLGTLAGIAGFGGLAWVTNLSSAIAVAGLTMVALGLATVARWPETWAPRDHPDRWMASLTNVRRGAATAVADRTIALVLVGTFLVNGGAMGFGRLFEQRLVVLGLPSSPAPIVWFAAIALAGAAVGAIGLGQAQRRISGAGVATRLYIWSCAAGCIGLGLFALAPDTRFAIAGALVVSGLSLPVGRVAATILVNRRTKSAARATVHSLLSQAENLGEATCGIALTLLAASTSSTVTLVGSAVLIGVAGFVVAAAPRRL